MAKDTGKKLADMMYGQAPAKAQSGSSQEMKATPVKRPAAAGAAGALKKLHEFASKPFGYENPPGEMISELLGIPAVARTLERIGYDEPLTTGKGMTTRPKEDTVEALLSVAPLAPMTKGQTVGAAIKPKGGNWVGGRLMGNIDESVGRLEPYKRAGAPPGWQQNELQRAQASLDQLKANKSSPRMIEIQEGIVNDIKKKIAVNDWVSNNLGKYAKNLMGTPDDPVRKLFDKRTKEIEEKFAKDMERAKRMEDRALNEPDPRRQANFIREAERMRIAANTEREIASQHITHLPEGALEGYSPDADMSLRQRRTEAGFPAEGLGESEAARRWETMTDESIVGMRAGDIQETKNILAQAQEAERAFKDKQLEVARKFDEHLRSVGLSENEIRVLNEKTPTIDKAAIVQDPQYEELSYNFNKLRTELRRDEFAAAQENPWIEKLDPETQVYSGNVADTGFDHVIDVLKQDVAEGRIRPEQLSKVSVEDAVRRTTEYDREMAEKMAAAQVKSMEAFPVHKEYPEGYKWIELTKPERPPEGWETSSIQGMYYDPTGQLMPDPNVKLLEDALKNEGEMMGHCVGGYCPDVLEGRSRIFTLRGPKGEPHVTVETAPYAKHDSDFVFYELQDKLGRHPTQEEWDAAMAAKPERIVQIKGKQNEAPIEKYLPFVQDFVKSGKWSEVGDLQNTGLMRVKEKAAQDLGTEYVTEQEFKNWLDTQNPSEGMAHGGRVHISDNPDTMQLELAGGGLVSKMAKALTKEAKAAQEAKKASEVLGQYEGHPLMITQSDRTKVGGKWLGGPGFSGLQHTDPAYKAAEAAWAVGQPITAKTILGGYKQAKEKFGKEPLMTAMIGTPTQHQSNKMVFEELHRMFTKSAKEGNLDPEQLAKIDNALRGAINKEGKPIFPEDVSILDKNFRKVADTFDKRAVASSVMGGTGVGGKKGQIIDYDAVIRHTTDPLLLDAPTGALGNRAFTLSGGIIDRPDLHPAFPSILQGEDIGQLFAPVPRDVVMRDFIEKTMREKGRTPGYMDYIRGYPPTQLITEDILTEMQKKGYAKGGKVKREHKVQNPVHFTENPDAMRLALTKRN